MTDTPLQQEVTSVNSNSSFQVKETVEYGHKHVTATIWLIHQVKPLTRQEGGGDVKQGARGTFCSMIDSQSPDSIFLPVPQIYVKIM